MKMSTDKLMGLFPPTVKGDYAAICEVGFQLALRLDELINLIKEAEAEGVQYIPGTRIPVSAASTQVLLTQLIGLDIASFPTTYNTISVGTTVTTLAQNGTGRWLPVNVTNLGNSQAVSYGMSVIKVSSGPLIPARKNEKIYIPPNETLYAIVGTGAVDVAVNVLAAPRLT